MYVKVLIGFLLLGYILFWHSSHILFQALCPVAKGFFLFCVFCLHKLKIYTDDQFDLKVHTYYNILKNNFFNANFITSAKEVMFLPGFICGFVSLFVNKITQKLMHIFL